MRGWSAPDILIIGPAVGVRSAGPLPDGSLDGSQVSVYAAPRDVRHYVRKARLAMATAAAMGAY